MKKERPRKVQATVESSSPSAAVAETVAIRRSNPLPRPARRRRKHKLDRGLPGDAELVRMAEAYLERQHRNYPAAAGSTALPLANPEVIQQMVDDFKRRHRGGHVDADRIRQHLKTVAVSNVAGAYQRFSCDNSNPTSVVDQLVNCLDKSAAEGRFVPWDYVYADFAVTGLDASRQGYSSYKKLLSEPSQLIETTYIDDFSRASRDELEWWKLAALSKRLKKRMIGASDGFDLSNPNSELLVTIFGLVCRLFIKSLREKVGRGMRGAARRFTCLGKLPLGFTKRQKLDATGDPMIGADGLPIYEPCVDPVTSESRRLMFELYVNRNWSCSRIAKHFSQLKVDNWEGWTTTAIRKLLWSPTAIGVFVWNMTRRELDLEEMRWVVAKNPASEWVIHKSAELAIVPINDWRTARRKIAARRRVCSMVGRKKSRNEVWPTTLFSGTLFCSCCRDNELKLIRSTKQYKQLGSVNGLAGSHGCKLSTSKSTRIIEECLLDYLRTRLLTPEVVTELIAKANAILDEETQKPIPETANLKKKVAERKRKIERLVRHVSETDDENVAAGYDAAIKRLTRENQSEIKQLLAAEQAARRTIERLDVETALQLLNDLRSVLSEDIAVAGPAIRELTGPILIRQEPIPGSRTLFRWIAQFRPQVAALICKLSPTDCGRFCAASLPKADKVEVIIEKLPAYERHAKDFQQMRDRGASVAAIASAHKLSVTTVENALHFADSGLRPYWKSRPRSERNKGKGALPTRYKDLAPEVVRLVEDEGLTYPEVVERLDVCIGTIRRAYDYLRPEAVAKAVATGTKTVRRKPTRRRKESVESIKQATGSRTSCPGNAAEAGSAQRSSERKRRRHAHEHGDEPERRKKSA